MGTHRDTLTRTSTHSYTHTHRRIKTVNANKCKPYVNDPVIRKMQPYTKKCALPVPLLSQVFFGHFRFSFFSFFGSNFGTRKKSLLNFGYHFGGPKFYKNMLKNDAK